MMRVHESMPAQVGAIRVFPSAHPLGDILPSREGLSKMGRRRYQHPSVLKTKTKRPQWFYRVMVDVLVDRNQPGRREKAMYLGFCDEMGKREAEKLRDAKLKEVNNTPALIQSQVKFADILAVYRSTYLPGLKKSTAHGFEQTIKKHVEPTFGALRMFDIDSIKVQQWIYRMEDAGLARSSRRKHLSTLRSVFEAAADWGYTSGRNPCKRIKLGSGGEVHDRRPLEPWQVRKLLLELDEEPLRLIVETALYTGLRISEILGLTWGAVDAQRAILEVRQGRSQQGAIDTPKSAHGRRVLRIGHLAGRFVPPPNAKASDLIWPDVLYFELQRKLVVRARRAGLEFSGLGFHTLRRTYATLRDRLGITVKPSPELQRDMGHSTAAMTSHYIKQNDADAVEQMRNLINTSGESREEGGEENVVSIDYRKVK